LPSEKTRRVSEKRRARNKSVVSATRTVVKKAREAIESGSVEEAEQAVRAALAVQDKAASKGIMHANAAARSNSRLSRHLNALKAQKPAS
jgi:small subunit ribosomal protein S20